jgi:hypothetical protein
LRIIRFSPFASYPFIPADGQCPRLTGYPSASLTYGKALAVAGFNHYFIFNFYFFGIIVLNKRSFQVCNLFISLS